MEMKAMEVEAGLLDRAGPSDQKLETKTDGKTKALGFTLWMKQYSVQNKHKKNKNVTLLSYLKKIYKDSLLMCFFNYIFILS